MFEWCLLFGTVTVLTAVKIVSSIMTKPKRLKADGKSLFVTGCDSGIGNQCARRFDRLGFKVFAGCFFPDGEGAKDLKKSCSDKLTIVPLDITSNESVAKAVELINKNLPAGEKGLYGLVNNAGILIYAQYDWFTMQQAEMQVNVNLLGTLRVTKHCLDLIIKTPGRIVNVTSINGKFAYPGLSVYCATKFGLEGYSDCLRYEMKKHNVKVSIIEPGDFSSVTNILDQQKANVKKMIDDMSGDRLARCKEEMEAMIKKMETGQNKNKVNPEEAQKLYNIVLDDMEDALLAENPGTRYVSAPRGFRFAFFFLTKLPGDLMDKLVEKLIKRSARKSY